MWGGLRPASESDFLERGCPGVSSTGWAQPPDCWSFDPVGVGGKRLIAICDAGCQLAWEASLPGVR